MTEDTELKLLASALEEETAWLNILGLLEVCRILYPHATLRGEEPYGYDPEGMCERGWHEVWDVVEYGTPDWESAILGGGHLPW